MDVSVVIPTYKPQDYIWDCLDSLSCQTLDKAKFEVILVLNGCCEPWNGQIKDWISVHKDLNITFIQTDTPGVSNARNIGMKNASGRYITFIDDDDYVSDVYLAGLLSIESQSDEAVVLSNSIAFNDCSNEFNESYKLRKIYYTLKNTASPISLLHARSIFNGPCMKLIPMSFIQDFSFDTSFKNSEDALFMFQISKNFKQILIAPEECVYYRRVRTDSAYHSNKSISYVFKTQFKFIVAILKIYFSNPIKYNLAFATSRILAALKTILLRLT